MRRHGPMVLGVRLGTLGGRHGAEGAFQASFQVLAHRASSLGEPARLASWRYEVALRAARNVRARRTRYGRHDPYADAVHAPKGADVIDPGLIRQEEAWAVRRDDFFLDSAPCSQAPGERKYFVAMQLT